VSETRDANPNPPTPDAGTGTVAPLDQVMLAMDVVDTLRHEQDLVAAELDEDRRQRDFIDQVQAIYESQGIDVPAAVIAEGVQALRENRFLYKPPARSWSVRLAELYVERGKWAARAALVLLLLAGVYVAIALPGHFRAQGRLQAFFADVAAVAADALAIDQQAEQLEAELQTVGGTDQPTAAQILTDARTALAVARERGARVRAALTPPPGESEFAGAEAEWEQRLGGHRESLAAAIDGLGRTRGLLSGLRQLRDARGHLLASLQRLDGITLSPVEQTDVGALRGEVTAAIERGAGAEAAAAMLRLNTRIDAILTLRQQQAELRAAADRLAAALSGVDVESDAARDLDGMRAQAAAALTAGDAAAARAVLHRWQQLVDQLEQSYELRIATGRNVQSGVWRESIDHPGTRNYYLIVEAIGADGNPLRLPITSEEDRSTRPVRRFGIRVPEHVYEAVKADKLDNGIVDRTSFGHKRRGRRAPDYEFPVSGGMITEW